MSECRIGMGEGGDPLAGGTGTPEITLGPMAGRHRRRRIARGQQCPAIVAEPRHNRSDRHPRRGRDAAPRRIPRQAAMTWSMRRVSLLAGISVSSPPPRLVLPHRGGYGDPASRLTRLIDHVIAGLSRGSDGVPRLDLDEDDGRFDYAVVGDDGRTLLARAIAGADAAGSWPEVISGVPVRRRADRPPSPMPIRTPTCGNPHRTRRSVRRARPWPLGRSCADEMLPILLATCWRRCSSGR